MKWQEPPESNKRSKGFSAEVRRAVEVLREHPGQWALILEGVNPGNAPRWRLMYPDIEFRTSNTSTPNRVDVYARAKEKEDA